MPLANEIPSRRRAACGRCGNSYDSYTFVAPLMCEGCWRCDHDTPAPQAFRRCEGCSRWRRTWTTIPAEFSGIPCPCPCGQL